MACAAAPDRSAEGLGPSLPDALPKGPHPAHPARVNQEDTMNDTDFALRLGALLQLIAAFVALIGVWRGTP